MNTENSTLWQERILNRQASGLTVGKWCEKNQLSRHTYYYWKKRIHTLENSGCMEDVVFAKILPQTPEIVSSLLKVEWNGFCFSIENEEDAVQAAEFVSQLWKRC